MRILREVAGQIEVGHDYRKSVPIRDSNGNEIGSFMLVDELAQREAKWAPPPFDAET